MERAIQVLGDVKDLSELLQGASIDRVRLLPSDGGLKLDMELTRACLELPPAGGFLRKRVPWVKSRLVIGRIHDAAFERAENGPASQASLLACDSIGGGYTLSVNSHDGFRLVLNCDALEGDFRDIGKPAAAP